jgi:hypothetical protein
MPLVVPTAAEPAQEIKITLADQACRVRLFAREVEVPERDPSEIATMPPVYVSTRMTFLDLYVDDALVVGGTLCRDRTRIVRDAYLGFLGDLAFVDAFGTDDPWHVEFGTRFFLIYWSAAELA